MACNNKPSPEHLEDTKKDNVKDTHIHGRLETNEKLDEFAEARAANHHEHELTVIEALHAYPYAVLWSLLVSMSVIMEGYDTILIGSLYGYPAYKRQFGFYDPAVGTYVIKGAWMSALGSGPVAGSIFGAFINGLVCQRFGYKPAFIGALILMIAFVFISFFGETIELQVVGQVLCGLPWGAFATIGPAYASELCPLAIRPYLTAYTNMCFAIGQLIGAGVLQSLINRDDQWSYRIPFAIQWLWTPFLLFGALFMPESPWWLVRNGQPEKAERSLLRLMTPHERNNAPSLLSLMVRTNHIEMEITKGTSYLDCFRGVDLRRTEIACIVFLGQITCGAQFAYSATFFFEQAGMKSGDAYKLNLGDTSLAFCGTVGSWFLMKRFGRRKMYLCGMASMFTCLMIIGFLGIPNHAANAVWGQAAMCFLWLLSFSLTIGPVGWTVPAEVSSTRLRSKTVVLARNTYYVSQVIANVLEPFMMNPTDWNWKGKTGFFWAGTLFITLVWAFFRMPETKNRTNDELDVMFANNIPTWRFKDYSISAEETLRRNDVC